MRSFWRKVKLILILLGITSLSCLLISSAFISKYYTEVQVEDKGKVFDTIIQVRRDASVARTITNNTLPEEDGVDDEFKTKLKFVAKSIFEANKHVRGSKTSDYLKQAIKSMNDLLNSVGIDHKSLYKRSTHAPKSVCPETFMGTTFGYPFFYHGFEPTNCTFAKPLWKLVTIVKVFDNEEDVSSVRKFVSSVYNVNVNLSVIVSLTSKKTANAVKLSFPNLVARTHDAGNTGNVWNNAVNEVNTPYVLIARNVEFLTNDSRLERLVREFESLNVVAVSGASRDGNGHWKKGCFQSVYRNYSLRYLEGYDESLHECIFCDYTEGPFVTSRAYLLKNKFLDVEDSSGLFEDWFLDIASNKRETAVCPDAMFHVNRRRNSETKVDATKWMKMMKKWNIIKMQTPFGVTIRKSCDGQTGPNNICKLQHNADAVNEIMKVCEENGMFCELQEGTALGAVKFEKTLPWEMDADLTFLTANFSEFNKIIPKLVAYGMDKSSKTDTWCCVDGVNAGGKFKLRYKGWNIEMYGQHIMDSERMTQRGIKSTKVLLDGKWVTMPRNPGLFVRNRYGREIYQHALHWLTTGDKSGWINYKTNIFAPCDKPGAQFCLDRNNADGNLPFEDMLP
ncbi:hypothetical protein ACF0H5_010061 [Mactra antiquata]